jgi:hypothetical protein
MNEDMLEPCQCCGGKMRESGISEYSCGRRGCYSEIHLTCEKCNKSIKLNIDGKANYKGIQQAFMAWNNMCRFREFCNVKD